MSTEILAGGEEWCDRIPIPSRPIGLGDRPTRPKGPASTVASGAGLTAENGRNPPFPTYPLPVRQTFV